jgi:probable rRNA maturation factor
MINLFFEEIEPITLDVSMYDQWLSSVCKDERKKLDQVNLIFCSDEYLLNMNREYLQHDYYTDIISFDYCEGKLISGDLFISKDRVEENAANNQVKFFIELNRVIVHGVLHLCGYKDKTEEEAQAMRSKEDYYLSKIVSRETF